MRASWLRNCPTGWSGNGCSKRTDRSPPKRRSHGGTTGFAIGWNGVQQGAAGTRNFALARARGEMFRNLDDDDRLSRGALRAAAAVLAEHDHVAYVVGPALDLVGQELVAFPEVLPPGLIEPMVLVDLWRARDHLGAVHPTTLCARRDVVLALGGYPAIAGSEDTALLMALSATVYGWQLDVPVLEYRRHDGQTLATSWAADPHTRSQRYAAINARVDAIRRERLAFHLETR